MKNNRGILRHTSKPTIMSIINGNLLAGFDKKLTTTYLRLPVAGFKTNHGVMNGFNKKDNNGLKNNNGHYLLITSSSFATNFNFLSNQPNRYCPYLVFV